MPAPAEAPASALPAHVGRYLTRVDAHLPTLSAETRREFLSNELDKWQDRYSDFQLRVAHGMATSPEVDAADFIITIAELDRRSAAETEQVAA